MQEDTNSLSSCIDLSRPSWNDQMVAYQADHPVLKKKDFDINYFQCYYNLVVGQQINHFVLGIKIVSKTEDYFFSLGEEITQLKNARFFAQDFLSLNI